MKHSLIQISLGHGLATTAWGVSYRGFPRISGEYCDAAFRELELFLCGCLPPCLVLTREEIVCQFCPWHCQKAVIKRWQEAFFTFHSWCRLICFKREGEGSL